MDTLSTESEVHAPDPDNSMSSPKSNSLSHFHLTPGSYTATSNPNAQQPQSMGYMPSPKPILRSNSRQSYRCGQPDSKDRISSSTDNVDVGSSFLDQDTLSPSRSQSVTLITRIESNSLSHNECDGNSGSTSPSVFTPGKNLSDIVPRPSIQMKSGENVASALLSPELLMKNRSKDITEVHQNAILNESNSLTKSKTPALQPTYPTPSSSSRKSFPPSEQLESPQQEKVLQQAQSSSQYTQGHSDRQGVSSNWEGNRSRSSDKKEEQSIRRDHSTVNNITNSYSSKDYIIEFNNGDREISSFDKDKEVSSINFTARSSNSNKNGSTDNFNDPVGVGDATPSKQANTASTAIQNSSIYKRDTTGQGGSAAVTSPSIISPSSSPLGQGSRGSGTGREVSRALSEELQSHNNSSPPRNSHARGEQGPWTQQTPSRYPTLLNMLPAPGDAAMSVKRQQDVEARYGNEIRTLKAELEESESRLLRYRGRVRELENDRTVLSASSTNEAHTTFALLEHRDTQLRKMSEEMSCLRELAEERNARCQSSASDLNAVRTQVAVLKQEVLNLKEGVVWGLEKEISQLRSQLREAIVQGTAMASSLISSNEREEEIATEAALLRAEKTRLISELSVLKDDASCQTLLVADLRARDAAAAEKKKDLINTMALAEQAATLERNALMQRITQLELTSEHLRTEQDEYIRSDQERHSFEVDKMLVQISHLKKTAELHISDKSQWEVSIVEMKAKAEGEREKALEAEESAASRCKDYLEQIEKLTRTHTEVVAALTHTTERAAAQRQILELELEKDKMHIMLLHEKIEREAAQATAAMLKKEEEHAMMLERERGQATAAMLKKEEEHAMMLERERGQATAAMLKEEEEHAMMLERERGQATAAMLKKEEEHAMMLERERGQATAAMLKKEEEHGVERECLLAAISAAEECAERERSAHCGLLLMKGKAAAAERVILLLQLEEAEKSFTVQKSALSAHIAALKGAGVGEREALVSVLSSVRAAAEKEKDMMDLLQVAENSHIKEHDAMLLKLTLAASQVAEAQGAVEKLGGEFKNAFSERDQLAAKVLSLKVEEETLLNLLADFKDAYSKEKEILESEKKDLCLKLTDIEGQLQCTETERADLISRISQLEKTLLDIEEEKAVGAKERSALLTRLVFVGEQRSDLLLGAEEAAKRVAEQAATIAGLNEEWESLQTELSASENERAALQTQLREKEEAERSYALQHDDKMASVEAELRTLDLRHSKEEAALTLQLKALQSHMDKEKEKERVKERTRLSASVRPPSAVASVPPKDQRPRVKVADVLSAASLKLSLLPPPTPLTPSITPPPGAMKQTIRRSFSLPLEEEEEEGEEEEEEEVEGSVVDTACAAHGSRGPLPKGQGHSQHEKAHNIVQPQRTYTDTDCTDTVREDADCSHKGSRVSDLEATMREIERRQSSFSQRTLKKA